METLGVLVYRIRSLYSAGSVNILLKLAVMRVSPAPDLQGGKLANWKSNVKTRKAKIALDNSKESFEKICIKQSYPSPVEEPESFVANFTPYSFLIVDDNEINLRIFRKILLKLFPNSSVQTEQDPALVDITHQTLLKYDLIFLDIEMPIITGTEFARRVRSLRELDRVGLIAVTTKFLCADLELYEKLGFDFSLRKPVEYPTNYILSRIEQVLAARSVKRI